MYVLIADDHANVRRGLREIVADAFSGAQCSEAANGDEVLTQLAISQYEALLLDINMPGRSGLDVLQDVKHMYPKLPVIMVMFKPSTSTLRAVCGPQLPPMSTRTALRKSW